MTEEREDRPRMPRDRVVSAAILLASVVGVLAAWLPWHSLVYGAVEVRGLERLEGKALIAALAFTAILAGYHLLAGGPLHARTLVAATGVATGAALVYVCAMARPESSVHELVRTVLGGTFCPGILVASLASVAALVLALSSLRHSR
jgi:hypothetical protein